VCAAGAETSAEAGDGGRTRRLVVEGRGVRLCATHAAIVTERRPSTWEALRALFVPPGERRSLLGRRAGEERRVFPRPEGRRKGAGRRASDRAA
jgi:hypothetical protein